MTQISSIGAGLFSDMSVHVASDLPSASTLAGLSTQGGFAALFKTAILSAATPGLSSTGQFIRLSSVREFPPMGTPPNIVNVPVYGSKTSQQIQGHADAPSMELQLNYIASDWAASTTLGDMVGDGIQRAFRFALLNSEPTGTGVTQYASSALGLGLVENTQFFWVGKVEALQVTPNLTDSNTSTVTMTIQSEFFGAFTD